MQNRHSSRPRFRTLTVIVGVLGALAAFDATLLLIILLFTTGPAAYGGLAFAAGLALLVFGGALAWTAWLLLRDDLTTDQPEGPTLHA